jgi:hypothetical protein
MKELLAFYFRLDKKQAEHNYSKLFRLSLLLYLFVILIYSALSLLFFQNEMIASFPFNNRIGFIIIKMIGLLLKEPIQVFFITIGSYLIFGLFSKNKLSFPLLYKILFIAFNIVVLSYLVESINIILKYYSNFQIIDIFKYSLNDIFLKGTGCSQSLITFFARINIILVLSIYYSFLLLRKVIILVNMNLLIVHIIITFLLVLFLFSALPGFFLSVLKFAS